MAMTRDQAEILLRKMLGPEAVFRDDQWEAVDRVANRRQRLLVVQRTGWGKSIVYFLAAKILRDTGSGPALLISPLISLMRNQLEMAGRIGIRAAAIHGENLEDWREIEADLENDRCDILLIAPERLGNREFLDKVLPRFNRRNGLFVVDEAHCISDWGHDFRPDYRRIVRLLQVLPVGVPVLCTTATANDRVVRDVTAQIPRLETLRGPLVRPSLKLFNIKLDDQADRLAWLACYVPQLPMSGIVYCLTIDDTRRVAAWLQQNGIAALPYHADLEGPARIEAEQKLVANEIKALVATVALGMGFDKPDLGFVIHFQRPGSVVAYYQQVGRAGRAVEQAFGILLSGREDDEIQDYFIRSAFPPAEVLREIVQLLEQNLGLSINDMTRHLNYSWGTFERALRLLEADGAVERQRNTFWRTANPWAPDVSRSEQVTRQRRAELEQIRQYVDHGGCLMEFLARALDDPAPGACGKCMNCAGQTHRRPVPPDLAQKARQFLRGNSLDLAPRLRWPPGLVADIREHLPEAVERYDNGDLKSTIPAHLRLQPGQVLCLYGDAGWGLEVAAGKYETHRFKDELVEAAARLIREEWRPEPPPACVVPVPSLRPESPVHDFARRLAARLGLPLVAALEKTVATRPQKEMQNSAGQVRNLLGAFAVAAITPGAPVLLVDDVVDSGWTLTVAGVCLQLKGSGPVYPFALAKATPKGG